MAKRDVRDYGWVAAGLLTVLTVFVFFVLQNYGPESAVRRFHEAAVNPREADLGRIALEPANDRATQTVQGILRNIIMPQAQGYRVLRTDRRPDAVLVEVAYVRDNRVMAVLPWIVLRRDGVWKVSTLQTLIMMQRYGVRWA